MSGALDLAGSVGHWGGTHSEPVNGLLNELRQAAALQKEDDVVLLIL